jgi:DNA polymerase-3 subunit gamma/tau
VQYALGDAVAVGDAKGVFELVSRLVQEGQDLRFVTNEVLAHFRNLLLVKTAPGQHDLLDVADQEAERLAAQATKYSTPELGRVIALLIAAQTDMRWTTSPRLSLELALIRSTIPETDATPEALVSRLERLERVAGIRWWRLGAPLRLRLAAAVARRPLSLKSGGSRSPSAAPLRRRPRPRPPTPLHRWGPRPGRSGRLGATGVETADAIPTKPSERRRRGRARSGRPVRGPSPRRFRSGGGDVCSDVTMLRSNWPTVISHLRSSGKAVLPSFLEIATPASFDGTTLELVFPPERPYGVQKVIEREAELRQALQDLFGITPAITCVIRARGRSRRTGRGRAAVGGRGARAPRVRARRHARERGRVVGVRGPIQDLIDELSRLRASDRSRRNASRTTW